jgi:bifunctional UDP-N-acetylglucosamine pyrophosphorylase/glucosamine-1-phosphate N-acetyltransferase
MRSATAKLLHDLCGRPLIGWPVAAALDAGAARVVVVVSEQDAAVGEGLPDGVVVVRQALPNGTGGAVLAAAGEIDRDATLIVLAGDVPLVEAELLGALAAAHEASGAAATMVTITLADPGGYGRVVRDASGAVQRVVETKSESGVSAAVLAIDEINSGVFAFSAGLVLDALAGVEPVGDEIFLPGVLELLAGRGDRVATFAARDAALLLGVNDRAQLAVARAEAQRRIHDRHMLAGVTIVEPASTTIDADVEIAADSLIEPCTQLRRQHTRRDRRDGRTARHRDRLAARRRCAGRALPSRRCELRAGATVGPFAYLRPQALLRERAKAGDVRRDQELRCRCRGEGAAPVLHRRHRHRRGHEYRRRLDHRQLRRRRQAPHDDRRACPRRGDTSPTLRR